MKFTVYLLFSHLYCLTNQNVLKIRLENILVKKKNRFGKLESKEERINAEKHKLVFKSQWF